DFLLTTSHSTTHGNVVRVVVSAHGRRFTELPEARLRVAHGIAQVCCRVALIITSDSLRVALLVAQ
ncbi:hypothetical protein HAX54_005145, partial [Datura stramonium]|nr:hypothetical protein [Datura stramonium]